MARNNSQELIIDDRRQHIATLRRQRLTMRQIARKLAEGGRVNPQTGEPWTLPTIKRDLDTIQQEAHAAAIRDVSLHKADILTDYHELLRIHWEAGEHESVRRVLKDMRDLLGTDAPTVIVFEQVQARMEQAYSSLKEEFGAEPDIWSRVVRSLMERSGPAGPGASAPHLSN